jgi:hypothetical protein
MPNSPDPMQAINLSGKRDWSINEDDSGITLWKEKELA